MNGWRRRLVYDVLPPAGLFVLVALGWHAATKAFNLPPYFLPAPLAVAQ